jgi:hypothetical protein
MQIILIVIVGAVVLYLLFKAAKIMLRIVIVLVILGIAFLTNPELGKHREAVDRKAETNDVNLSKQEITRDDYKLFSLTRIQEDDSQPSLIGIGAFTRVWIFKLGSDYYFF